MRIVPGPGEPVAGPWRSLTVAELARLLLGPATSAAAGLGGAGAAWLPRGTADHPRAALEGVGASQVALGPLLDVRIRVQSTSRRPSDWGSPATSRAG
jgi:hypothetical protein